ncbi:MAG: hypothetical protein LAP21_08960 [Acidobacteriia bacterium]|nr:hypothetical protein [Terriglobia bacterium]
MRCRVRSLSLIFLLLLIVLPYALASGPVTGTYKVVIVRVLYSDSPAGHTYTNAQMDQAVGEIHNFFSQLSYGALDMQVSWKDATLGNNVAHYWYACPNSQDANAYCVKDDLFKDAAEAAAVAGASFTDVKALTVLSPCGTHDSYDNWTGGSDVGLNSAHVHRTVHKVVDTECSVSDPALTNSQPSGVWWGGWAHELGHTLQLEGHDMFSHPSGYASGYDLMDSCYPCGESVYSRSGSPVVSDESHTSFPQWLPASKTITIDRPSSGVAGGTYVLEPVSKMNPSSTVAPRGIKLPLGGDHYYMIDARVRVGADTNNVVPGLYDEGIQIQDVVESRNDSGGHPMPVKNIWSCDTTVSGGCISTNTDPRIPNCHSAPAAGGANPDYCWPFPLFHPGNTWYDAANNISVHVINRISDGYTVTVTRGVAPGHPDVLIIPWLTAPMNTYETVDIWVDSSCNGYEDTVGPSGLRYGRRPDGTVIGNGDDPCANHENRIYAHVRNGGDATANNVHVHFLVTDPPGVGVRDANGWVEVGSTTIPTLTAGAAQDVYVNWTPSVTLTPAQISDGHFNFHTCVQIKIDAVAGELITSNQDGDGEQENFDHFEAVRDPITHNFHVPDRDFYLFNHMKVHYDNTGAPPPHPGLPKHFQLRIKSEMPPDWNYEVAGGETELVLAAEEVRKVPVKVKVPPGTPVAKTFFLRVTAFDQEAMINPAVPESWPAHRHYGWHQVAGVVEAIQTVDPSTLTVEARYECPDMSRAALAVPPAVIHVKGHLDPVHRDTVVAIDYTPPGGGAAITRLVHTDAASNFEDRFPVTAHGIWLVRALWQGDMDHSSSVSDETKVMADRCQNPPPSSTPATPQVAPPNSVILVPDEGFAGGLLTGVVIGPDDQPVANTPVEIADGGVPATLGGEVIGEPEPCKPGANDPNCPPEKERPKPPVITTVLQPKPPVDCAALLKKANPVALLPAVKPPSPNAPPNPNGVNVPAGANGLPPLVTDSAGRFALCIAPNVPAVNVNLPGGGRISTRATSGPPNVPKEPPDFLQPNQKVSLIGLLRDPKATQAGRTWLLPAVQAWSPDGGQVITAIKMPRTLALGPVQLSYTGSDGKQRQSQSTVFKIVRASLDRARLFSNEGAAFEYEVQFQSQTGQNLCVEMHFEEIRRAARARHGVAFDSKSFFR